ncbi:PaaI family thioesterase [Aquisalimonas lutea]|uniref:PaaI family thioesterase n=1 Tax=Aquisalimonas lutea TaxID=1327750 RepID=UPI0025B2C613|nr:PaaI family thioesterase [Aquisalimonas lutea]MDN3518653.1 PaaI family thioesterase [Aquisalimonas lutea]
MPPESQAVPPAGGEAAASRAMLADHLLPGIEALQADTGRVVLHLPFDPALVGDPRTGHVHGGVLTALLDKAVRLAVLCRLPADEGVELLDLRVDHLRATAARAGLQSRAVCRRLTAAIGFVAADVVEADSGVTVVTAAGSVLRTADGEGP